MNKLLCILQVLVVNAIQNPILIIEIFRHGAREPGKLKLYHHDIQYPEELTAIGQALKKQYSHLFGDSYNPLKIYVRSTKRNRTLNSVQSQLYGIYPTGTGPKLPVKYNESMAYPPFDIGQITYSGQEALPEQFQPIPIHTTEKKKDYLLFSFEIDTCPNLSDLVKQQVQGQKYKELEDIFKDVRVELTNRVKNHTGVETVLNFKDAFGTIDNIISEYYKGIDVPVEYNSEFWHNLTLLYDVYNLYEKFGSEKIKNITKTPILNDIVEKLEKKTINAITENVIMYSAHDTTLYNILNGLRVQSWECLIQKFINEEHEQFKKGCPRGPIFSSNIIFELHQPLNQDGEYTVRFLYDNHEIFICSDNVPCTLKEFKEKALSGNVQDYYKECGIKFVEQDKIETVSNTSTWQYILIAMLAVLAVVILGFTVRMYTKVKSAESNTDIYMSSP